jgi:dolichol-phosphate mannosyltransferase
MYAQTELGYELVVGSRYLDQATVRRLPSRGVISRGAMGISHLLLRQSRQLTDPMSGFFIVDRRYVKGLAPLSNRCKLLLYVLATHEMLRMIEVPFSFEERGRGESKTVNFGPGFIFYYLIEVLTYFKMSPADPRFEREDQG